MYSLLPLWGTAPEHSGEQTVYGSEGNTLVTGKAEDRKNLRPQSQAQNHHPINAGLLPLQTFMLCMPKCYGPQEVRFC